MLFSQYKNRSDYSFRFEVAPLSITVAILMVQFFIFKDYTAASSNLPSSLISWV